MSSKIDPILSDYWPNNSNTVFYRHLRTFSFVSACILCSYFRISSIVISAMERREIPVQLPTLDFFQRCLVSKQIPQEVYNISLKEARAAGCSLKNRLQEFKKNFAYVIFIVFQVYLCEENHTSP